MRGEGQGQKKKKKQDQCDYRSCWNQRLLRGLMLFMIKSRKTQSWVAILMADMLENVSYFSTIVMNYKERCIGF